MGTLKPFNPMLHFVFKGNIYMRRRGRTGGGALAHNVCFPDTAAPSNVSLKRGRSKHITVASRPTEDLRAMLPRFRIQVGSEVHYADKVVTTGHTNITHNEHGEVVILTNEEVTLGGYRSHLDQVLF
jgi:hypothetical protein